MRPSGSATLAAALFVLSSIGGFFQKGEVGVRLFVARATHLPRGAQAGADCGAIGTTEEPAPVVVSELHTPDSSRFAERHAGNRRRDRQGYTARPAADPTFDIGRQWRFPG